MASAAFNPVLDIAYFGIADEGNTAMFYYKAQEGFLDMDLTFVYRDGDDYFVETNFGDPIQLLPQDASLFDAACDRPQQFFCEINSEGDVLRSYSGCFLTSAPPQVPGV